MTLDEWKKEFTKKSDDVVKAYKEQMDYLNKAEFIDKSEDIDNDEFIDFVTLKQLKIYREIDKLTE